MQRFQAESGQQNMRRILLFVIAFCLCMLSCRKEYLMPATDEVQVKIQNATSERLESVQVGDNNFGTLYPLEISSYQIIGEPIYAGVCQYVHNGAQIYAGTGVCGTPLPPPFAAGYYTFKITPGPDGYNEVTVIKN